jgi:tRNA pseudouridine38-40 synthase
MENIIDSQLHRYLVKVWFIGTRFNGSQRQLDQRTIEGELLFALKKRGYIEDAESSNFKAATRTDAGVHARCAVFGFNTSKTLHITEIDAFLPEDMGIWAVAEVPIEMKPRFEVKWKQYYYIYVPSLEDVLDIELMQSATQILLGEHNFRLLSKNDISKDTAKHIITIYRIEIQELNGVLLFSFKANAFLWQLIRRSVNYLLEIGRKNLTIDDLNSLFLDTNLQNERFKKIGPERAEGLILWHIEYGSDVFFKEDEKCLKRMREMITNQMIILTTQVNIMQFWKKQLE